MKINEQEIMEFNDDVKESIKENLANIEYDPAFIGKSQSKEYEPMKKEEFNFYQNKMLNGTKEERDVCRKILFDRYMPIVENCASYYEGRGIDVEDLIQEGCLGLNRALDNFDSSKGVSFFRYAIYPIRQSIQKAIVDNSRTIRLPANVQEKMKEVEQKSESLVQDLGRNPSIGEIAEQVSEEVFSGNYDYTHKLSKEIEELLLLRGEVLSLNTPVSDEDELIDTISEDNPYDNNDFDISYFRNLMGSEVLRVVGKANLSESGRKALYSRCGIGDGIEKTFAEIAEEINTTEAGARSLFNRTIKIMRRPPFDVWNELLELRGLPKYEGSYWIIKKPVGPSMTEEARQFNEEALYLRK